MRSIRPVLFLTPLALAGAAVVMWPADSSPPLGEEQVPRRPVGRTESSSRAAFPISPGGTVREATAEEVIVTATTRRLAARLDELNHVLGFTSDQKREVRSLLARSSAEYDPTQRSLIGTGLPPRLTRTQAQERIHDMLDPIQQADYEEMLLDDQLWWSEVMERLERDLVQVTDPAEDLTESAETADQDPPPAPAAHRGGNVFDLLNPPEP